MYKAYLKKWILLGIITLGSLSIGLRTGVPFFYFFFWLLVSSMAINVGWLIAVFFGVTLHIERKIPERVYEDEIVSIETHIKNNSVFPLVNLVMQDVLSCAATYEQNRNFLIEYLAPGASDRLRYTCLCCERGKYSVGPFTAYYFDLFHLFFIKRTFVVYSELYVYPRTFAIKKFPELTKGGVPWFGIGSSRVSGAEDDFFGVREYQSGDPLKKVHWFSTARQNKLIVKQFQAQSFFRATLIFSLEKNKNFGEGKERVSEYMIKIAASVARHLIAQRISLEVIMHAQEVVHIPFNKGEEHLDDILKYLTMAKAESQESIGEVFQALSRNIPNNSTLIVIMLDQDWEHIPRMLELEQRAISLIPLIVIASTFIRALNTQETVQDTKIKLMQSYRFKPVFFFRGGSLEEAFLA